MWKVIARASSTLLVLGCQAESFPCQADRQCGVDGVCTAAGFCGFPSDDCESGIRYGKYAGGGIGGQCVPVDEAGTTTGDDTSPSVTSSTTQAMTTGADPSGGPTTTGADPTGADTSADTDDSETTTPVTPPDVPAGDTEPPVLVGRSAHHPGAGRAEVLGAPRPERFPGSITLPAEHDLLTMTPTPARTTWMPGSRATEVRSSSRT